MSDLLQKAGFAIAVRFAVAPLFEDGPTENGTLNSQFPLMVGALFYSAPAASGTAATGSAAAKNSA